MSSSPSQTEIAGALLFIATVASISYTVKQALAQQPKTTTNMLQVKSSLAASMPKPSPKTPVAPHKDTLTDSISMKGRLLEEYVFSFCILSKIIYEFYFVIFLSHSQFCN